MQSYQGGVSYEEYGDFQTLSDSIASNIKKISQNVSSISKMVNQLQTPQDSQELRNQLRQIQNYTYKLVKDTSTMLKVLMKMQAGSPANTMVRDRLSDEYMATLNTFQSTQRLAAQKSKEDVKKVKAQSVTINIDAYPGSNQISSMVTETTRKESLVPLPIELTGLVPADGKELVEMDTRRQEQMTAQTERSLVELEERERDVRQLEEDILAVNDIFKDLGMLIHTQGAAVDSIESHVEYTAENVESGVTQLGEASAIKNKMRKRKVYIGIILVIVISIIIILIVRK